MVFECSGFLFVNFELIFMGFSLVELAGFLVRAKKSTYAGNGSLVLPQKPGFKELEFRLGDFYYRDSYTGYYQALGMETVYFQNKSVWAMSYNGGMKKDFYSVSSETFGFLKKALSLVPEEFPFRGPKKFKENDFEYSFSFKGNIEQFVGEETIKLKAKKIYSQNIIGGLIIEKEH